MLFEGRKFGLLYFVVSTCTELYTRRDRKNSIYIFKIIFFVFQQMIKDTIMVLSVFKNYLLIFSNFLLKVALFE